MSEHGLNTCGQSKTVIWCEGLTDMLAAQTLIGKDSDKFAVIGMPGASQRLPREHGGSWMEQKSHWVAYDGDEAGAAGAAALAADLVAAGAKSVRIVQMPDGKDMRDWINEGNGLHELDALAESASELVPENEADRPTQEQNTLGQMGITGLGINPITGNMVVHSRHTGKWSELPRISTIKYADACLLFGTEIIRNNVLENKNDSNGVVSLLFNDFLLMLAAACEGKSVNVTDIVKRGIWRNSGDTLVVNGDTADTLDSSGKLVEYVNPMFGTSLIRKGVTAARWYDREKVNRYIELAADTEWRKGVLAELKIGLDDWHNLSRDTDAMTLANLLFVQFIKSFIPFRPQISITGGSKTGKSMLVENFICNLMGPFASKTDNTTSAGFRQLASNDAGMVILDESDRCLAMKAIRSVARTCTRNGSQLQGGKDGIPVQTKFRQMFMFLGITSNFEEEADRNRYIELRLDQILDSSERTMTADSIVSPEVLEEIRHKMIACALVVADRYLEVYGKLKNDDFPDSRIVECYAVPVAMRAALEGLDVEGANKLLGEVLAPCVDDAIEMANNMDIMASIMQRIGAYRVRCPRGATYTISQIVEAHRSGNSIVDADGRSVVPLSHFIGLGVVYRKLKRGVVGTEFIFMRPKDIEANIFNGKVNSSEIRRAAKDLCEKAGGGFNPNKTIKIKSESRNGAAGAMNGISIPMAPWDHYVRGVDPFGKAEECEEIPEEDYGSQGYDLGGLNDNDDEDDGF